VHVGPLVPGQPGLDVGMLVGGVVVGNRVDVQSGGHLLVALLEKDRPFLVLMVLGDPVDQLAVKVVQGGEQRQRTVADVIVRPGSEMAGPRQQSALSPLQCLALRLLVAAQHQGLLRWVEIEAGHVLELCLEILVLE